MNKRVLIVDDDKKIVELLQRYFESDGYDVAVAYDGEDAITVFAQYQPDLLVLDYLLPKKDGRAVCRAIREQSSVPVLMLSARDAESDRLIGLDIGADDYVGKPFSPREILARAKAILRRSATDEKAEKSVVIGALSLDTQAHAARYAGGSLELTPTEYAILKLLACTPNRAYSRSQILERIQDVAFEGYDRTIDVHIKNLRKKIPDGQKLIVTVFGVGYKLVHND